MHDNQNNLDLQPLKMALIDSAWRQWQALGTRISAGSPVESMVDPEALLLLSLTLRDDERRLRDVLNAWAHNGSGLFSLQRVKNLVKSYPDVTNKHLSEFAHRAVHEGKDFRWRSIAADQPGPPGRDHNLLEAHPFTWQPTALILRLRLGIGVGIAPDLLSFLISLRGAWTGARQISQATGYTVYAVRRVADDMAGANLIESTDKKPVQYRARFKAWQDLLDIPDEPPPWRYWQPIYAFSARLIASVDEGKLPVNSPYLLSSALRDLYGNFQNKLALSLTNLPDPHEYPGEQFAPAFTKWTISLSSWLHSNV